VKITDGGMETTLIFHEALDRHIEAICAAVTT
jgi:hypothetical protein